MKRILSIFLGVSASLLAPLAVFAAIVSATENFSLILPSNSSTYTIRAGSTFNKVYISGSSFTVTLDPNNQTIITASGRQNLSNNQNIETVCTDSQSSIVLAVATSGSTMSFVITPSGTCTTSTATPNSGGGGGSSGSSGSSAPATSATSATPATPATPATSTTPAVRATPATPATHATPAMPATPAAPALSAPGIIINRALATGSTGNDVKSLQQFLASDKSIYPEGIANGNFGPKTLAAVKRFQEKYGIAKKGQQGYGVLGPKTRAKIKELSGGSAPALTPAPSNPSSVSALQAQLQALQEMLKNLQKK